MSPKLRAPSIALGLAAIAVSAVSGQAWAQASGCGDVQKHLDQRRTIAQSLQPAKGKQLDAKFACSGFGRLVANGETLLKWTTTNKEWCQIPDSFIESIKGDHAKATAIRARACNIAAKVQQMEKQAKSGQGGGLLGGGGLTGSTALPRGAL
ncbi:hypothetical protein [Enterovirga rhinocerotis]|uniref:Uncharacterized protein n=1 Tax=Enterovirga rhinocerotis TaxID=1339210 RepID=A0A4R7C5Q6_9HYPH|nr:hypothetical protein [Enterovirga rhinocerotis]TDR93894.1 hypothetical protein EV668_1163 [Enterovirga rhinocerotis]